MRDARNPHSDTIKRAFLYLSSNWEINIYAIESPIKDPRSYAVVEIPLSFKGTSRATILAQDGQIDAIKIPAINLKNINNR